MECRENPRGWDFFPLIFAEASLNRNPTPGFTFFFKCTRFPTVENAVSSKRSPSKQLRFPQKAEFKRSSFKRSQASNEKSPVMYVTYTAFFTLGKRVDAGES